MLKLSINSEDQLTNVCRALSTPLRIHILQQISDKNLSIVEIAEALNTSISTIASNVKILEDAGLIITNIHAATRGTKRVCTKSYADIFINLDSRYSMFNEEKIYEIDMPIGHYIDCNVHPTCGLIGTNGNIASEDHPSSFFNPARVDARHIWFRTGYVNYRFPNDLADFPNLDVQKIAFSLELCSEAPNYDMDWSSDITFWVNGVEVTTWTCPSDFGDRNGKLKSNLWERKFFTQYGVLKTLLIDDSGTYLDDQKVSSITVNDLNIISPIIDFKIGIKEDAENKGGINLFGVGFGDYDQNIIMTITYHF
ncbi:helix-turn-helix domain-containing protein [Oscillospiraceae bacterium PP1C4]